MCYRFNYIGSFFLKDAKAKKLEKEVKLGSYKTLYTSISKHLVYIIIVYLNILILKALTNKITTNINMLYVRTKLGRAGKVE
jgi:hypothetical protein